MQNKIIFIGAGNIAEAIFGHLLSKLPSGNESLFQIIVTQRNQTKREALARKYPALTILPDLDFVATVNDIVILAIKPFDAETTCHNLKDKIRNSTIVSIMTGITTNTLSKWLDNNKIARVMPNTPAATGSAVSGIYFLPNITPEHKQIIEDVFKSVGSTYILANEDYIDRITAVSGSSPAYIFYFIECLIKTAIEQFEFDKDTAKEITLQVVKGALDMINNNPEIEIPQLRKNVTSKKGTTEQALQVFERYNLAQIIKEAELACYNRAIELSKLHD